MANYDAAINISVNGQSKIDKLIDNLSRVDRLVDSISSEPIELSIASVDKNIAQATASASAALKKFSKEREGALDSLQKAQAKYQNQIVKSQSIIADAESRGATNTKKYANAVASQQLAISKLSEAQQKYGDILGAIEAGELSAISTRNKNIASLERNRKSIETINKLSQQYINISGRAGRPEGVPLANLQAQVDLFRQLSNSVKTTSEDYRRFTLASVTAEIDTARESLRKYQVIADAAIPRGGKASTFGVQSAIEYKGLQSAIQELINTFPQVTKSEAGLQSYRDALASTLSLIPYGTDQYIKLAGAIKQVDQAMSARLSTADAAKPFGPAEEKLVKQGPATDLVTQGLVERQRYADRKLKVEQNLYRLTERIEDSVGDQSEKTRLLVQANQALNALSEDRLEDAARELSIIERQRQAYSRLEKQQVQGKFTPLGGGAEVAARQRFDREQTGGQRTRVFGALGTGFSPISGQLPSRVIEGQKVPQFIPGSPAAKLEQARRDRQSTEAAVALAQQKQRAVEKEAEELRKGTQAATALGKQKLRALEEEARILREQTSAAVALAQQKMREEKQIAASVVGRGAGQAFRAGGPGAVTASLTSPKRLASQQTSALLLQEKLTGLEIKGVSTATQRASLQQIINGLTDDNLQLSDEILNNFDDQLNGIRDYIKLQNQVVSNEKARQAAERRTGGSGATGGGFTGFGVSLRGLEASLAESGRFFGGTSPAGAVEQVSRRFGQGERVRDLTKLPTRELSLLAQSLEQIQQELKPTTAGFDALNNQIGETRRRIQIEQAARDPDADFFARRRIDPRVGNAISEGLIGGAFPLLFGQGLGASIGGGVGGAAGGFAGGGLGFGLSLIGTALGTAFDTAIQAATEFGAALNDVSTAFGKTKEKALFSSREIEKYATKLEEAGLVASASALAQQEIIRKIGASGVERLRTLESSSDRLNRAWAELNLQLQAALAGPMAGLLEWVANIVSEGNKIRRGFAEIEDVRSGLSDADKKEFDRRASEIEILSKLPGLNPKRITREQAIERQVALAREFAPRATKVEPVKLTPELVRDELVSQAKGQIDALNTQLEAIDIGKKLTDQLRDVARQQEDLNQQVFDARRQYEEAIGDIRLGIERTVQRESLDGIRAQNELYQVQGEIRLQQLNNANQALISEQGVNDYGRRLFEILGQAASLEVSTQQDIENRKRQFQLEMQSKELEAEIFKGDIAKQVAKLNEDSERRIADINKNVRRANEQYDQQRFKIEKAISQLKVKQIEAEIQFNRDTVSAQLKQAQAEPSTDPKTIQYFQNLLNIYEAQTEALKKSKQIVESVTAPPSLQEVGGIATQGVSTAAYDAAIDRARALSKALLEANEGLISLVREGKWAEIKDQFVELADQGYKAAVIELQDIVEAVRNGGDAFAGAAARLAEADKKVTESLNSIGKQSETDLVKKYREGGLTDEQISLLLELAGATNVLARAQLDATQTAKFYSDSISAVQSKIQSLTEEIKEATTFGTNYEKALQSLASRGLSLADKEAQALIKSAQDLDILEEKAAVLNGIKTASEGLSGSMRGLIENFYELGSASEALKAFNEEISKKAVGLVLDIAFRPVEENIRKSLIMFGEKIGFDFSTPAEKQLTELQTLNRTIDLIRGDVNSLVQKIISAQPAPAVTSVSPGTQAAQVIAGPASQRTGGLPVDYVNSVVSSQSPQIKARLQSATTVDEVLARGEAIKREYLNTAAGFNIADPAARSQLNKLLNDLVLEGVKNRADEIRRFTGRGGPIDDRGDFPTAENFIDGSGSLIPKALPTQQPIPVHIVPGPNDGISPLLNRSGAGTAAAADLQRQTEAITQSTTTAAQSTATANAQVSETIRKNNAGLNAAVPQWGKNLAGVVTSLSLAATGVIGILGGIQQIKEGGTGNILSGIGGILTTLGGIGLSAAGMFSGGAGGAGGAGGFGGFFSGGSSSSFNFDPGAMLGGPAFTPFAKGGVVQSPTLFQFANGGQFGVMGEAGAEAVMPLKRGPDGRLGVEQVSEGGDSSSRLREAMGRSPAQGGQASEFRIKFETTVINGVEYVSKDQLDQAMEQTRKASISEGAKRGMGMTLDKLKQSPSTRSRVGIR